MDSVEFIKNIKKNSGLLVNFFDSTMALYNLMRRYEGIEIINENTAAKIRFTVVGDQNNLERILREINGMYISGYMNYKCSAYMEGGHISIILTEA